MTTAHDEQPHTSIVDTVDRSVRDQLAQAILAATEQFDSGPLGRADEVSLLPALARVLSLIHI